MRPTILNLCSGNVSRAALLLAAAAALGGCSSDTGRFSDPIYTGSTPNQRAILGNGDSGYAGSSYAAPRSYGGVPERQWQNVDTTGSIEPGTANVARADLAPPPSGAYADTVAHPLADATRPAGEPGGYTQVAAAGGWTPAGGSYVTLRQGETLDTLSNRYGVPVAALRQTNNYAPGRMPAPGERVLIPVYNRPTAATAAPTAAPTPMRAPAPQAAVPPTVVRPAVVAQPVRTVATTRVTATPSPLPPQHMTTGTIPAAPRVSAPAPSPAPVPPVASARPRRSPTAASSWSAPTPSRRATRSPRSPAPTA